MVSLDGLINRAILRGGGGSRYNREPAPSEGVYHHLKISYTFARNPLFQENPQKKIPGKFCVNGSLRIMCEKTDSSQTMDENFGSDLPLGKHDTVGS